MDQPDTQYLTFRLAQEEYGVEILKVQEIKGLSAVTPLPNTPAYVRGVMNLRGTIVPVMDLRARLGMAATESTAFSVIIVVHVDRRVVGLVVDAVSDVLDIETADIQPAPDLGGEVEMRGVQSVARADERLVLLLALDAVLAGVDAASGAAA